MTNKYLNPRLMVNKKNGSQKPCRRLQTSTESNRNTKIHCRFSTTVGKNYNQFYDCLKIKVLYLNKFDGNVDSCEQPKNILFMAVTNVLYLNKSVGTVDIKVFPKQLAKVVTSTLYLNKSVGIDDI